MVGSRVETKISMKFRHFTSCYVRMYVCVCVYVCMYVCMCVLKTNTGYMAYLTHSIGMGLYNSVTFFHQKTVQACVPLELLTTPKSNTHSRSQITDKILLCTHCFIYTNKLLEIQQWKAKLHTNKTY